MGGGRAVFGVLLGVAIVAALVFAGSRWLPHPEKKIEWVHSIESVIVQMKTDDSTAIGAYGDVIRQLEMPDFTLYGDGTLIVQETSGENSYALREAKLSTGDVRSLLKFMNDTGFFNFSYARPPITDISTASTTYFYAATKDTQNAVSAQAIDSTPSPDSNSDAFRKLQQIKSRLDELASDANSAGNATDYEADTILIVCEQSSEPSISPPAPPEWPFPDIDLAGIAASPTHEQEVMGDLARQVQTGLAPSNVQDYFEGLAGYRPVLPHEDNFPEFEPPAGSETP